MVKPTKERFGKLIEENNDVDFPYYNGQPVTVPVWKWVVAWLGTFAGFLALSFIPASNNVESLVSRVLFTGIPLVVFWLLTKPYWKSIFRKLRKIDFFYMLLFGVLTMILTPILATLVTVLGFPTAANQVATESIFAGSVLEVIAFYVGTAIQLLGEELLVIIPFLGVMSVLHQKFGVSRKQALIWAWIVSSIWFGAIHLPTYHWNFVQAIVIIGGARITLTLAFIRTKNIWVSTGAHIINDWVLFTVLSLIALAK